MARYTPKPELPRIPFVPKYKPSSEQQVIFDQIKYGRDNLMVDAGAGSGKTTTALWAMTLERHNPTTAFMAFNVDIAREIKSKAPFHVEVGTAHSFGLKAVRSAFRNVKVWDFKDHGYLSKSATIMKEYDFLNEKKMRGIPRGVAKSIIRNAERLMSLTKLTLADENDKEQMFALINRYSLEFKVGDGKGDIVNDVVAIMPKLMDTAREMTDEIDFDDMIWLAKEYQLSIPQSEQVYVDECQDLSNLLRWLAARMAGERIVTVGDEFQAIYGFAGANTDSVDLIVKEFDSKVLPLMTCYRCGHKIIEEVNKIMPKLKAHPDNSTGEVVTHYQGRRDAEGNAYRFDLTEIEDGSMILCRRNSGLIRPCFEFLKKGRRAIIKGKNIGDSLDNIVTSLEDGGTCNMTQFLDRLEVWKEDKMEALNKRANPPEQQIELIQDQHDAIKAISEGCSSPFEIKNKISMIFSDEKIDGVTLSSIHKSKGLEADRVVIVQAEKIRICTPKMKPEDHIQERNLEYVAKTRPRHRLDLVYSESDMNFRDN